MIIETQKHISALPAQEWDDLRRDDNPFTSYGFLRALEESGSVGGDSGWDVYHLLAKDEDGTLQGAMPCYLKYHSYGEYVFDHSWANGFERAGGRYYPKLLSAIPFTPVPGPRILSKNDEAKAALIAGLRAVTDELALSSAHVTFLDDHDKTAFQDAGWQIRTGVQFHWHNQGYQSFDDFLSALSSRKRKNIRKERASLTDHGVTFLRLTGDDITPAHWDRFYEFYLATIDKKWGGAYLNRAFFDGIGTYLSNQIVLVLAQKDGDIIAGALNLSSGTCLYGRNWGALVDIPNLHFETCYYQAIDHAIATGLARVEAGAQGMHKVQRGYVPVLTYSAHYLQHDGFSDAVARFLQAEDKAVIAEAEEIRRFSPYRLTP